MNCEAVERDLDAFIDREIETPAAFEIREHVSGCAVCRRRIGEREALQRLVKAIPYYSAPDRLRHLVAQRSQGWRSLGSLYNLAAAAVLTVAVVTGVTVIRSGNHNVDVQIDAVIDGHVRSLMAEHLFDVRSTDQHTVKPWFLGKLDFSPPVVDLLPMGFPLVGGRLDYLAGKPVAALVYQRQKHTINVFVSAEADGSSADMEMRAKRGFHVRHWIWNGLAFWAVSDLNDGELTEFARALQRTP